MPSFQATTIASRMPARPRRLSTWLMVAVLLSLAQPARSQVVTEVLQRCSCPTATECGTCTQPRCCGPSSNPNGVIVCLAGEQGGTPCADLQASRQFSLAADAWGNLFVGSSLTDKVFRLTPGGCVTTVMDHAGADGAAFLGGRGLSVDAAGNLYMVSGDANSVFRVARDGTRSRLAELPGPVATGVDGAGNLYVTTSTPDNSVYRIVPGSAETKPILGPNDGVDGPRGVAVDTNGNVFVAVETSSKVFRIAPDGTKTLVLGVDAVGPNGFRGAFGVAVDADGNLYATGFATNNVVKLTPEGAATQILGPDPADPNPPLGPREIAVDAARRIYVTFQTSNRVVRLDPQPDGSYRPQTIIQNETATPLRRARGLAIDPAGRVFVAGENSSNVVMWAPEGGTCGNGVIDEGEACDYRASGMTCCCSVACQLVPAQSVCNDGAFCTAVDRCTDDGACAGSDTSPCPGPDGDGDCTESCNEPVGDCSAPDPAATSCTDDVFCNGADACNADGVCTPSDVDPCAGGAECADTCNADGTCFTPVGTPCADDGNPCTAEQCDGGGACASTPGNAGTQCGLGSQCRAAPTCDGLSAVCPVGTPLTGACQRSDCDPNRSICQDGDCVCLPELPPGCGNGTIDDGELCGEPGLPDGPCCAGCRFASQRTVCRPDRGVCDPAELCSGFSADCPPDELALAETSCEDGDPCTEADACKDGTCTSVRICEASLDRSTIDVSAQGLVADLPLGRAFCSNPTPETRRAAACSVKGLLLAADAVNPGPDDCLDLSPDVVTKATRRRARLFAQDNTGAEQVKLPLRLSPLAIKAIRKSYRDSGSARILVCVTFSFNDESSITLTRELKLNPGERHGTRRR